MDVDSIWAKREEDNNLLKIDVGRQNSRSTFPVYFGNFQGYFQDISSTIWDKIRSLYADKFLIQCLPFDGVFYTSPSIL